MSIMKFWGKSEISKTPAEWCKTGEAPFSGISLFAYKLVTKAGEEKKRFPKEYADRVKEILNRDNYYSTPEELRNNRSFVIHADERGFCPFFDDKENKCMLGGSRPKTCR
jgi:Fe-S-cluster containining protein